MSALDIETLGRVLKRAGACRAWQAWVATFESVDGLLAEIQRAPTGMVPDPSNFDDQGEYGRTASVRWMGYHLTRGLRLAYANAWWRERWLEGGDEPLSDREVELFRDLCAVYAAEHGLGIVPQLRGPF